MSYIALNTELTAEGVVCRNDQLGKVATIQRDLKEDEWYVMPYAFPPYERQARFKSYKAAEFYALALAYEMHEERGDKVLPPTKGDTQ